MLKRCGSISVIPHATLRSKEVSLLHLSTICMSMERRLQSIKEQSLLIRKEKCMSFSARFKGNLFYFPIILLVILGAFMLNGVFRQHASAASASSSPTVYVRLDDGNVYALNATNGARRWSYPTGFRVQTKPAVANGIVYVGSQDNYVYALQATTGA